MDTPVLTLVLVYKLFAAPSVYQRLGWFVPRKEEFEKLVEDQTALEDQPNFWGHGWKGKVKMTIALGTQREDFCQILYCLQHLRQGDIPHDSSCSVPTHIFKAPPLTFVKTWTKEQDSVQSFTDH